MRDKITLADDPFSAEYFARFTALTDSIGPLMDGDPAPYVAYLKERRARAVHVDQLEDETAYCENQAACVKRLAESIRDDGYNSSEWRHCGRQLDYGKGQGPITVTIGADGTINSWDGLHRSAILRHLGEPVIAEVYRRNKRWVELRAFHKTLYTPYPHPDLAGRKVLRPGFDRFRHIFVWFYQQHVQNALVVGACTGFGVCEVMNSCRDVHGIEPNAERFEMAKALTRKEWPNSEFVSKVAAADFDKYGDYHATIGLSVYHHVARTLPIWRKVAAKLAACPVQILELPADSAKQWHDQFRADVGGECQAAILTTLRDAGEYTNREVIYTDSAYANRQTIALWRE